MGETKDSYIVEIPVDEEHKQKQICVVSSAIQNHPLTEISRSPGHLLFLKLLQREEDLSGRRIAAKETRMESARREVSQLACFFVIFHAMLVMMVFASSSDRACGKWWVPGLLSGSTSVVLVGLVQVKLMRFWKVWGSVQRERSDGRAVTRCVQELRMKGSSFDLSKDTSCGKKRMKSSSVEIKWKPITWCSHYLVTVCLVSIGALLFPASKLILCTL